MEKRIVGFETDLVFGENINTGKSDLQTFEAIKYINANYSGDNGIIEFVAKYSNMSNEQFFKYMNNAFFLEGLTNTIQNGVKKDSTGNYRLTEDAKQKLEYVESQTGIESGLLGKIVPWVFPSSAISNLDGYNAFNIKNDPANVGDIAGTRFGIIDSNKVSARYFKGGELYNRKNQNMKLSNEDIFNKSKLYLTNVYGELYGGGN